MRGDETVVDGRNSGQEGDGRLAFTLNLVLREERRGQTLPDSTDIEGKHEFDS